VTAPARLRLNLFDLGPALLLSSAYPHHLGLSYLRGYLHGSPNTGSTRNADAIHQHSMLGPQATTTYMGPHA